MTDLQPTHGKDPSLQKRTRTICRICCIALAAVLLAANLGGCIWYRSLSLAPLQEFRQAVRNQYPHANVSCQYDYSAGVSITVSGPDFDDECAFTILGYLQPIVCDEEFIQDLFDLFEQESHGDQNWKLGRRPEIWVHMNAEGTDRYQFTARANKEGYNSGRAPDSYTWDGYTTWYGTEIVNDLPQEISPEEIKEAVRRYS